MNGNVIAIANQKGGVGKTTTTVNLSSALSRMGKKVLVIDVDPQASCTASFGFKNPDEINCTLTDVFKSLIEDDELNPEFEVLKTSEGVDLMPSNIMLCGIEIMLVNEISREMLLKSFVDSVKNNYDYVILDCMPSLGMLTFNALCAADRVLIPSQPDYLSTKGLDQLLVTISRVRRRMNPKLKVEGILLTMVDTRTTFMRDVSEKIRSQYNKFTKVYNTVIPRSIRAAETSAEGVSIFEHDPKGKVSEAYLQLAREVINNEKQISRKGRDESVR